MQLKNIRGSKFQVQASGGKGEHFKGLKKALISVSTTEDLIFHCKNNSTIRTNKMPLLLSSTLFTKLLADTCPCPSSQYQEYDIICPDFDPDSMALVLELITTGATNLDAVDQHVYNGILNIIDILKINVKLKEIWSNTPTTKKARRDEHVSLSFDSHSQDQRKESYSCKICYKEFHLIFALQRHMEQHLSMSRSEDSGLDLTESDQEEEISSEDLAIDTPNMEDVDLSTLVDPSQTNEIDKNSIFFCHECSIEVKTVEAFENHMDTHIMEIENESNASTSSNKKYSADFKAKEEDSTEDYHPDDAKTVVKKDVKDRWEKIQGGRPSNAAAKNSCPVCPATVPGLNNFLSHIATCHFKQQLTNFYTADNPTTCKLCVKSYTSNIHLLNHVVQKHHALKDVLPKDVYEKLVDTRLLNYTNFKVEDTDDKNNPDQCLTFVGKKFQKIKEIREKKLDGTDCNAALSRCCPICPTTTIRLHHLLEHVGAKHFKEQLLESYAGQDPKTCIKCDKSFKTRNHLTSHLVQHHRALKYIAPKDVYQKLESMRTPNYWREECDRVRASKLQKCRPSTTLKC